MGSAIRIRGWGWRYAGRRSWACRGVDLDIGAGERVLVVGPSGAGKSTLLRAVAGLLDPQVAAEQAGTIQVDGQPAQLTRDRVGLLLQDPQASLVMSRCGDDVAFGLENAAVPADEIWPRVDEALRLVGFGYPREHPTTALSGGEQQRLALAGALVRRPGVLVLDEPTAQLDPPGATAVLDAVDRTTRMADTTVLIVEHRVDSVLRLVDRVVVLEPGGGVAHDGPPAEVFAAHGRALAAAGVWVPPPWRPPATRRRPGPGGPLRLSAERIGVTYPLAAAPALADVTLTVDGGTATAVTGPNGSGKSTLAAVLGGLLPPDAGAARLAATPQLPLHRWPARRLCRRVGSVFQNPAHQFVGRTVRDELLAGPKRAGLSAGHARLRCDELLERLRLDRLAAANPFTLSGGEQRRLSVAAVLATDPEVLILDEPTFGQDARTWEELTDLLVELRAGGTGIVAVTHDTDLVAALADREVALRDGRVERPGEPVQAAP